jgi:hypothetical protein
MYMVLDSTTAWKKMGGRGGKYDPAIPFLDVYRVEITA